MKQIRREFMVRTGLASALAALAPVLPLPLSPSFEFYPYGTTPVSGNILDDLRLRLPGLTTRDYGYVAGSILGGSGLSQSSVSHAFQERSVSDGNGHLGIGDKNEADQPTEKSSATPDCSTKLHQTKSAEQLRNRALT